MIVSSPINTCQVWLLLFTYPLHKYQHISYLVAQWQGHCRIIEGGWLVNYTVVMDGHQRELRIFHVNMLRLFPPKYLYALKVQDGEEEDDVLVLKEDIVESAPIIGEELSQQN